jgi:hypothetical protein
LLLTLTEVRRRSLVWIVLALLGIASVVLLVLFQHGVAPQDRLEGIDVEAARARGADPVGGLGARDPSSPALPSVSELDRLPDAAALRAHVTTLSALLEEGNVEARGTLHVLLSTAHRLLGEHAEAKRHADEGVALAPESSVAHHVRARALAAALIDAGRERGWTAVMGAVGDIGEYKGELAAAIALDPSNLDARDEELAVYLFAPWPIGGAQAARERIEALAALDPLRGVLWRAQALVKDDRDAEALVLVDDFIVDRALHGEELERVCLQRGQLLQALDRYVEAAAAYEPVLSGRLHGRGQRCVEQIDPLQVGQEGA